MNLLSRIWNFLFGKEPCCDDAVSSLKAALDKLQTVEDFQFNKRDELTEEAAAAATAADLADAEAKRAAKVKKKLADLLDA